MSDISPVNANLDLKADLTKPVEDVTEIAKDTHRGLGKLMYALCGPMMEQRIGQAKRIAAQADRDCLDILAGRKDLDENTGKTVPIKDVSSVDALCTELERVDADCKAKRLAAAIMKSATEIKQIPADEISDEPLNQTFFNHWRAEAELIDEDDLRKWWAHLLVEEAKKPNSISPRTLHVARNLSREEANLFQRIAKGYCGGLVLLNPPLNNPLFGNFGEGVRLQDAGLLMSGMSRRIDALVLDQKYQIPLPFLDINIAIVIQASSIILSGYGLSRAGQELISILTLPRTEADVLEIAKHLTVINPNIPRLVSTRFTTQKKTTKIRWFAISGPIRFG